MFVFGRLSRKLNKVPVQRKRFIRIFFSDYSKQQYLFTDSRIKSPQVKADLHDIFFNENLFFLLSFFKHSFYCGGKWQKKE